MRNRLLIGLLSVAVCGANAALAQRAVPSQHRALDCVSSSCDSDSDCKSPCTGCFGSGSSKKCGVIAEQKASTLP